MYNHQDKYNEDAHTVYAVFAKGWLHEHVQRDAVDTAPRIRSLNSQWVEQFVDKWNQSILKWYCSENWIVSSVTEPTLSQRPHERPIGTLVLCLHPVVELTRQIWHRMQCHEGVSYGDLTLLLWLWFSAPRQLFLSYPVLSPPTLYDLDVWWSWPFLSTKTILNAVLFNKLACLCVNCLNNMSCSQLLLLSSLSLFLYFSSLVHPFHTLPFEILNPLDSGQDQYPSIPSSYLNEEEYLLINIPPGFLFLRLLTNGIKNCISHLIYSPLDSTCDWLA